MPSGSHGGSRGSHGGGGSRGGFGGSRSSGGSRISTPRVFIIGGIRYGLPTVWNTRFNVLNTCLGIVLFLLFFSVMTIVGSVSNIDQIKTDYMYYEDMIATAEADSRYVVEGIITDKSLGEGGKWFFDYEFVADDGWKVPGYTYSIYTFDEIREFTIGQTILIATNAINTTYMTDSIPIICKYKTVEDDAEYIDAQNMKTGGIVFTCLLGAGVIAIITAQIVIVKKHKTISPQEEKTIASYIKKQKTCAYCGSHLADNETQCTSCGAKTTK